MSNYGFVIDNRKCIGCHACSTACKSENEVPLGVNRTWVKYVETGAYPNNRRHFQVTRCNHCANPPCVRICPVTAMYQRTDGIVEFDPELCIGCKACLQACPYDAIYIDPNSGTAAKCHYCGHRTEIGLEPACVVVCPTHAIVSGDMDDPNSEISHLLAHEQVTVRKPEQGTAPKLFYINGNDVSLHPTATQRTPETYLWADVIPLHEVKVMGGGDGHEQAAPVLTAGGNGNGRVAAPPSSGGFARSGVALRSGQTQGAPLDGPIQIGGRVSEHMVQVSYNAQHKIPWHWPVPAYLVTKAIGAGIFMFLSLGSLTGLFALSGLTNVVMGFMALLFTGITTGLLVYDLERPERFLSIVFRPQWRSWLARGAYLLIGFSVVAGLWWLVETVAYMNWLPGNLAGLARAPAMWLGLPLAAGAAVYTAFLFGQAEGRDLWQSSLLPVHLLLQALMTGSGMFLLVDLFTGLPAELIAVARVAFIATLILDLMLTVFGEFGMPHASEVAARAAHDISQGHYRDWFWLGSILIGHLLPLGLMLVASPLAMGVAVIAVVIGLFSYEYAFVMAPQDVPNS
jgi:Fe-S-cluster-containing dehydrogenase component/formate-dependent nitrite reductase membrane component NrfD